MVQSIEIDLERAVTETGNGTPRKFHKAGEEFHTYIERNLAFIPNYGKTFRYGERINTGIVESTVNPMVSKRFCKKEQMQ